MIRFRTGDIVTRLPGACACGRSFSRFVVQGRVDDMLIISGVNVFPSDIEFVVRGIKELNGEYRITVYSEDHLTRFDVEVESAGYLDDGGVALAAQIAHQIKSRTGVRPSHVKILTDGVLPRATHKAKRLVDQREVADALKGAGI